MEHKSCILLTTRRKPADITAVGDTAVRAFPIRGLGAEACLDLLRNRQLEFEQQTGKLLAQRYGYNPLALKLLSSYIRDQYQSCVQDFLDQIEVSGPIPLPIRVVEVIKQQLNDLIPHGEYILKHLAKSAPASRKQLQEDLQLTVPHNQFLEAFQDLERRSLLEKVSDNGQVLFTLQSMVMEIVRQRLSCDLW